MGDGYRETYASKRQDGGTVHVPPRVRVDQPVHAVTEVGTMRRGCHLEDQERIFLVLQERADGDEPGGSPERASTPESGHGNHAATSTHTIAQTAMIEAIVSPFG